MKVHTNKFKQNITELGRKLNAIISYDNIILNEQIMHITPHYNADILKSVMKQLDLELSVDIPLNTIINCQIGILIDEEYEMLNFGNYVVYSSEKQEDTKTYKIVCYDKMLYAMKQNEDLGISYPISIKNYLNAIAYKIGLTVATGTFYNQDLQIPSELYLGQEYTYRDILDEIAQATGSIICLNENDEIQVKYPTITNDTIDEDYLKNVNVDFKQKYGPINSIVLSRSGESDNVYLRDEDSVEENGLTEVKIVDNQIMNFNNRSDYLQGILASLDELYYYLNDFNSTGILYYDVGDLYNVQIGENTYQCLMLNDEINVTTGIEEIIHTDMPQQSETDYEKADKTDMKINKTYIIVDKQNQTIESVVSNVTEQDNKISQITQTVDELNAKIQDIVDITKAEESSEAAVQLNDINESEPIMIKVHPTSTNISYLYPRENLYPSELQYLPNRILRFIRTYEEEGETLTENIDYELPDDLLRYSDTVYDEFYLDYDSQTCQVIKRCEYNADGTVSTLGTEVVENYPYPQILLGDGDYQIYIYGYNYGYIYVRLMAQNIYTTQFATYAQLTTSIDQTTEAITTTAAATYETKDDAITNYSEIRQTATGIQTQVTNNNTKANIIAKINDNTSIAQIEADSINLNGVVTANDNFKILLDGSMEAKNGTFSGGTLKLFNGTLENPKFSVSEDDYNNLSEVNGVAILPNRIWMLYDNKTCFWITRTNSGGASLQMPNNSYIDLYNSSGTGTIQIQGSNGNIKCVSLTQTSLENEKKNFEKLKEALQIIKNIDIYKYNFKNEQDETKKHIGFVIGKNFNYSKEITSENNDGVDIYSFVSVCCQAIKEQQEQIEQMKKEIEKLKGGK